MAELNKVLCKALWERYRTSEIEEGCFRARPVGEQDSASGKASFLGYGDFTIKDDLGFSFKVRSLEAKVIKGQIYLDFPSEKSNKIDPETGKPIYYPRMLTKTAESRDIMTKLFFRDENVRVQAEAAIARWNAAQAGTPAAASAGADVPEGEVSDDNPF
jgi:hypothetical protein